MSDIVLLGISHKTAPVELRECLAFNREDTETALERLQKESVYKEVLLFSTCNRVEMLLVTDHTDEAVTRAKNFLSDYNQIDLSEFQDALYVHTGDEAIRHIFRVASSLDSMMVGEPQILGQIKDAYRIATRIHTSGVVLNRLLHRSFFVAKRVRTETGIGDHAVSISYAAIELARKIFGELEGRKVLLIGAGEMAELAVEHLIRHRSGDIWVANRTFERGVELAARFNGQVIRFEEINDLLTSVDIIISSTGSPDYVIRRNQVKGIVRSRRNRPIFFIDIAVPRDIDPRIHRLANSYVYDIDDLKEVIEENLEDRQREAIKGERIVDEAVIRFRQWFDSLDVVPTIVALRKKLQDIAQAELKKTLHSLPERSPEREAIERMTESVIKKFLHDPTLMLKDQNSHQDKALYLDHIRKLFKLDD